MKDTFSNMHPFINFIFFALTIGFTMFIMNPVCLAVSFLCALVTALYLNGKKAVRLSLVFLLPMILLIVLVNPVFNHEGMTILTYFPWDNPLTLESIVYGIASAFLLSSTVLWFSSFNAVITSDKVVFLFGRIMPSLSLVISMALRFVPRFSAQMKLVRSAQHTIGRDINEGTLFQRIRNAVKILSIMITWSLENAIETADSMKSRGHGLKGRTSYSLYKFDKTVIVMCDDVYYVIDTDEYTVPQNFEEGKNFDYKPDQYSEKEFRNKYPNYKSFECFYSRLCQPVADDFD